MADYQKLYAYLVGQIDNTIQKICEDLINGRHGWNELNAVGIQLREILYHTEDMYLEENEEHTVSD